ncbi:hypothetical protein [Streptomyces sp. cg40]|uniref:hypothetical protein n=1 Tax=Streptomyces sp. cg40 TaxID=3419764 RepID=UPI003D00A72D
MSRNIALVFLEPLADQSERFESWLTGDFLPGILDVPGVESAQQFVARAEFLAFPPPPGSTAVLAELSVAATGVAAVVDSLTGLLEPGRLDTAADPGRTRVHVLEEFRPELRVEGLPAGFRERHPRDLLVFFLAPVAGREEEYHEWYDRAHIRDGLTLAGFATGQRFRSRSAVPAGGADSAGPFAALYEIYGEDLDTAIRAARDSAGTHEQSTAADTATMRAYALSSVRPPVRRSGRRAAAAEPGRAG